LEINVVERSWFDRDLLPLAVLKVGRWDLISSADRVETGSSGSVFLYYLPSMFFLRTPVLLAVGSGSTFSFLVFFMRIGGVLAFIVVFGFWRAFLFFVGLG